MEKNKRLKIFVDTNIIISGTFFSGNESKLLSLLDVDFCTCDVVIEETKEVVRRKLKSLGAETLTVALDKLEHTFRDFKEIIQFSKYQHKIEIAEQLIHKQKDIQILSAVMIANPDYFVTGDSDFFVENVIKLIEVYHTKQLLTKLGIKT